MEGCDRLLAAFGLHEVESRQGLRSFRDAAGLQASVHSGDDGNPARIEFPFEIPPAVRAHPEHAGRFADLIAWPLTAVLGEPVAAGGMGGSLRWWLLPAAKLTV